MATHESEGEKSKMTESAHDKNLRVMGEAIKELKHLNASGDTDYTRVLAVLDQMHPEEPIASEFVHGEKDDLLEASVSSSFWHKGKTIRFEVEAFGGSYDNPRQSAGHDMPFEEARRLAKWILAVTK